MLVLQRPRHTNEPRRSDDNPGDATLTRRLRAKICSDCHGLTIETRLTIEHVINVLHSNLWLPAQAGERPWRSETIGVAARKMNEYFYARRHPQVGFLVRFGFTTK